MVSKKSIAPHKRPDKLTLQGILVQILWEDADGRLHVEGFPANEEKGKKHALLTNPKQTALYSAPLTISARDRKQKVNTTWPATLKYRGVVREVMWQRNDDKGRVRKHTFRAEIRLYSERKTQPQIFAMESSRRKSLFSTRGIAG